MIVTFIGHADAPDNIRENLRNAIINLIENEAADTFYIGTHGNFDIMSCARMKELATIYPYIKVFSVLSYMPTSRSGIADMADTILPEEVAAAFPRYAIIKRNQYLIEKSDTVIAYVKRNFGGAAKSRDFAVKKKKRIIYIR